MSRPHCLETHSHPKLWAKSNSIWSVSGDTSSLQEWGLIWVVRGVGSGGQEWHICASPSSYFTGSLWGLNLFTHTGTQQRSGLALLISPEVASGPRLLLLVNRFSLWRVSPLGTWVPPLCQPPHRIQSFGVPQTFPYFSRSPYVCLVGFTEGKDSEESGELPLHFSEKHTISVENWMCFFLKVDVTRVIVVIALSSANPCAHSLTPYFINMFS